MVFRLTHQKRSSLSHIDRKIALSFGAVVMVLMLLITGVATWLFAQQQKTGEDRLSVALAVTLSESISHISFSGKYHARLLVEDMQKKVPDLAYISVESNEGQIIAHSDSSRNDQNASVEEIASSQWSLAKDKPVIQERKLANKVIKEIVLPCRGEINSEIVGIVRLGIDIANIRKEMQATPLKLFFLSVGLTIIAISIVQLLSKYFSRTMKSLAIHIQGILDHAPIAVWISDQFGLRKLRSQEADNFFQLISRADSAADTLNRLVKMDSEVIQNGHWVEETVEIQCDSQNYVYLVSKFPITKNTNEQVSMICTFLRDITEQKKAETALRDSEERFRILFHSHDAPFLLIEPATGEIVDANISACRFYGYSQKELQGMLISNINTLSPAEIAFERDRAAKNLRQYFIFPHRLKSGEVRTVEVYASPVQIAGRNLLFSIIHDVTGQKLAEVTLRESERRLSFAIYATSDAIWEWNWISGRTYYSPRWYEMLGYENNQFPMTFDVWKQLCHPDDFQPAIDRIQKIVDIPHNLGYETEFRMKANDGSWKWILGRGNVVEREVDGKPILLCGTNTDITERKKVEEQLCLTQFSINNVNDCIYLMDENAHFFYVNDAACKRLGYQRDEFKLMKVFDIDPAFDRDLWETSWEKTMQQSSITIETIHKTKSGEAFPVEITTNRIDYGEVKYNCAIARDITQRKLAEKERRDMERQMQDVQKLESLGVLAGGVAHDFNNILTAILGHADLALLRLPPDSPAKENISKIEKGAQRAADLCRQMLAYSGRGQFVIELINLGDLISEMVHLLNISISKKAHLHLNFENHIPFIEGDATQIRQILMNLITNASEAIGDHDGTITISTGVMHCTREYFGETIISEALRMDSMFISKLQTPVAAWIKRPKNVFLNRSSQQNLPGVD